MKRNLLFYLYPKRKTIWPWHVEQLLKYQAAWNGRRIVVLALDDWTVDPCEVVAALAPLEAQVLLRGNDRELGETRHFIDALAALQSEDPEEMTFYAHAKGVSRDGPDLPPIKMWCRAMYELNLERPEVIERILTNAAAVGAFRLQIRHSGAPWCYAGTYFWLKHSALFSRNWMDIEPCRYGVEGYPGRHLKFEESAGLNKIPANPTWVPSWLYGREGSGVTERMIQEWKETLWRTV